MEFPDFAAFYLTEFKATKQLTRFVFNFLSKFFTKNLYVKVIHLPLHSEAICFSCLFL